MPKTLYQVAILVDAGYLLHELYPLVGHRPPSAEEVIQFTSSCLNNDEERLFRIYFYDCPPLETKTCNPIDRAPVDFAASPMCRNRKALHDKLAQANHVAFRAGELQFLGWYIPTDSIKDLVTKKRHLLATDVKPQINQKRVDMKIGLDVAWLASKRIVDKIVLVTGDTDFVPAMKFARREGVQVIVATPARSRRPKVDMLHHADEFRLIEFPPAIAVTI